MKSMRPSLALALSTRLVRCGTPVWGLAIWLSLGAGAGCGQNDIKVYRVAKEAIPPQSATAPPGDSAGAEAAPRLKWEKPEGWQETPPGEMRVASFRVKKPAGGQADVSIVPLPGMAGGDLSNVNRWRDQVGLQPITGDEMNKQAQAVEISGEQAKLFDQAGKNQADEKTRILAAVLRHGDTAWFFKMTGDDELVAQQKPVFIEFLKSISFQESAATPQLPAGHPPIEGARANPPSLPAGARGSEQGKPSWQVPKGWQEAPAGQFLVAKFAITGEANSQATVNVSMSVGEGGGAAANINRWRGQLGLQPLDSGQLEKLAEPLELPTGKAMLTDMKGKQARVVGVIVPQAGRTWFYKLMGDAALVERQKDAFVQFVKSAKY